MEVLQSRITDHIPEGIQIAQAQQCATDRRMDKFFFGAALGLQTDTPDSTAYAIGLYGDYYLKPW
jgi:hypothetical protein